MKQKIFYKTHMESYAKKYNYQVLDNISLIYYDNNKWQALGHRLQKTRKDFYHENEKYFINHQDQEYFYNGIGFTTENFKRLVQYLDIDPCRFVIFTNQYKSTDIWNKDLPEYNRFTVIESPFTDYLIRPNECFQDTYEPNCSYTFSCFMGQTRCHRDKLAEFLIKNNLTGTNLVTYHRYQWPDQEVNIDVKKCETSLGHYVALSTMPFSRINENWSDYSCWNSSMEKILDSNTEIYTQDLNRGLTIFQAPWYSKIMLDLVTETIFDYPHTFISEKTIRPLLGGRPFIIVGAPNTIEWLHTLGFKTFDIWWSEDYDQIKNPDSRLEKIFELVTEISSWSMSKCNNILHQMHTVLEHNKQNYAKICKNITDGHLYSFD